MSRFDGDGLLLVARSDDLDSLAEFDFKALPFLFEPDDTSFEDLLDLVLDDLEKCTFS